MTRDASVRLAEIFERTGVAPPRVVARHERAARRLARGLPLFESVWLDAMVRSRVLTSFQAQSIAEGRGDRLRIGPYVLRERVSGLGYANVYEAVDRQTRHVVELTLSERCDEAESLAAVRALQPLIDAARRDVPLVPWTGIGCDAGRLWAVAPRLPGVSADQWLIVHGRMRPHAVLRIARQMAAALAWLEARDACHGDIAARNLVLMPGGRAALVRPGLRGALRPHEGIAMADLPPSFYDYLAPERIVRATPPGWPADQFACGCLWWELVTGRPPFAGGDALHKMRSILENTVHRLDGRAPERGEDALDVRRIAPDTPEPLVAAMRRCMAARPDDRFADRAALATCLGSDPTPQPRRVFFQVSTEPWDREAVWAQASPRRLPMRRRAKTFPWRTLLVGVLLGALGMAIYSGGARDALPPPADRVAVTNPGGDQIASVTSPSIPQSFQETQEDQISVSAPPRVPVTDGAVGSTPRPDPTPGPLEAEPPARLALPGDRPVNARQLAITRAGTLVGGTPRQRATVVVDEAPVVVAVPGVRFQHVDFVHVLKDEASTTPVQALVRLMAADCVFDRCAFHVLRDAASHSVGQPLAIHWNHPVETGLVDMPSGQISITDSTMIDTGGIRLDTRGVIRVSLENVLCAGAGPLLTVGRPLAAEDSVQIALAAVTYRGRSSAIRLRHDATDRPGRIAARAERSVFETVDGSPLLQFVGPAPVDAAVAAFSWGGEDSILALQTPVAVWTDGNVPGQPLDDFRLSIAGLARGQIDFAGQGTAPEANRVVGWQAPLLRDAPPGADVDRLP